MVLAVVDVVFVVDVVDVDLDVVVDVDVFVDVAQDASNIAAVNKKLKPNQINLFFIFYSCFISYKQIYVVRVIISAIVRN